MQDSATGQGLSGVSAPKKYRFSFLFGVGTRETRALTLSSGEKNRSKIAGNRYRGASWQQIVEMAAAPKSRPKDKAPFMIPSVYRECDGRTHEVQRSKGRFGLLVLDFDSHTPLETLEPALMKVLGTVEWLAYSSTSAKPDLQKTRVLVPLAELIAGAEFGPTQTALFELLRAEGLEPDDAQARAAQPVILPNRGAFYRWSHHRGPQLSLEPSHPVVVQRERRAAEEAAQAFEAREEARAARSKALSGSGAVSDDFEALVKAYNAQHDLADELVRNGWQRQGNTDNFRSPFQSSNSYATRVYPEGHAISLSDSDAAEGLGHVTGSGARLIDAFELFAFFDHGGDRGAAVRALRAAQTPRDAQGRFTGHAAISTDRPAPRPDFVAVCEATARIRDAVGRFVADRPAVMAIAASPGAGKSRIAREVLATALPDLGGDIAFYCPTHDLAEEAAGHFAKMGVTAVAVKGRLAEDKTRDIETEGKLAPHDTGRMCLRPHLAAAAREAGVGEGQSICKRGSGENEQRCPYWDKCPWVAQWALPEGPVVRCLSHAHLHLPDSSGRGAAALRVVDESCWQGALGKAAVPISEWLKPINPDRFASPDGFDEDDELAAKSADSLAAARDVLEMLQEGGALFELGLSWTVENLREFAKAEDRAPLLGVGPAAFDEKIEQAIGAVGGLGRFAGARAAIWRLLADALEAGRETSERVVLREHPKKGQVIEVHWRKSMPEGATLHLDADADQTILKALYPEADVEIIKAELKPNAAIIQTTDKSFSKTALIGTEAKPAGTQLRKEIAQLVRVEVLRDRAQRRGGVLVVATKGVVAKIFEEAGAEAKLGAELFGASWAWFGPATKGLNDWRDFGTVIEVGREELPPDVVEAQARSLWGDSDQPLELPKADEHGNVLAPETVLPVLMADGSAKALTGRAYADPRLRALQTQSRENAGRQAAERLRMAHAVRPKRWVRLNTVPLASAPVTELTTWSALRPDRLTAAVAEAAQGSGLLRLNPKGLAADAPSAFPSVKAAERWLSKSYTPPTSNRVLIRGGGGITALVRRKGQRGPKPTQVLIPAVTCPKAARAVLEEKLGPVAQFEVLEIVPTPQDDAVNEVLNRLSDLEKAIGYCPKVTVRPIESPAFVSGTFPPEGLASALGARGWPVELVPD